MKKIITLYIFCFVFCNSFSQVGEWTWISGDNYFQSAGHYGIQGIPATANYPPAVYEPCDWHDQQGNFWVFGGFCSLFNSNMADLWKYNPSTNEWTWMKGIGVVTNGVDSGYYGTMGVASPLNRPAGRGWGTPTWTDHNGNFWIYAGTNSADLWKYSIATNEWTWMQGTPYSYWWNPTYPHHGTFQVPDSMNTPGNRYEVTASWTDNNGNLWLFGGASEDSIASQAVYNDMWKYDVSINQWVWMHGPNYPNDTGYYGIKGIASPLNRPPARMSYAKWKDSSGNFYLFGGFTFGACGYTGYNDVWKYDIILNNWIWIGGDSTINDAGSYASECTSLSTNIPRNAFENRSTCYDSLGNVFMFGSIGCICSTYTANRNELWQYSIVHNEWTLIMQNSPVVWGSKGVSSPSNAPPKTFGSLGWYRNDEVWIFGGSDYGNPNSYNCMWRYKIDRSCFPTINLMCTDTNFCEKHCIDFYDLSTNNPTSWQWFFPGADSTSSTLQNPTNICYSTYGSFDVTLIACNGVSCDTLVLPGFINEYPLPVPIITQSNDTLFSSPGVAYQWWSVDSGIILGANNSYYIPTQNGNYYVVITDSIGCSGPSNVLTNTGIGTLFQQHIEVSPNPFTNTLNLKLNSNETSQIILYDITSRTLLTQQFINTVTINTELLAKGIYLYEVRNKNGVIRQGKVVKG